MQNAAHNGFGCPYCRTKMAETPELEDDDDYMTEEEVDVFEGDALTSFRMFHQQIDGEAVEEEEAEDWETVNSDEEEDEEEEEDNQPDATYMAQKLAERGVTFEDLVKNILLQEHSERQDDYSEYLQRSNEIYGQFRSIKAQYVRNLQEGNAQAQAPVAAVVVASVVEPVEQVQEPLYPVSEPKTTSIIRRREFINNASW
jgi:hypothetical protein